MNFTLSGGYQFADTFDVLNADPLIVAQAGRIAGAFHFRFEDGREARAHVTGATANRVTARGGEIFGTMKINMFEAEAEPRDSQLLFLAYDGDVLVEGGSRVTVDVRGRFIGGTGRYAGATGDLELTSVNGVFTDGRGGLRLAGGPTDRPTAGAPTMTDDAASDTAAAVARYFAATRSGSAAEWTSRFAEDAVVDDPVGSVVTGSDAIRALGEQFLGGFRAVGLTESYVFVHGRRAVAKWDGRATAHDGRELVFEGINHFEFDGTGRIAKLTGWWSPARMRPA